MDDQEPNQLPVPAGSFLEFDWDEGNLTHIGANAGRNYPPEEIESVWQDAHAILVRDAGHSAAEVRYSITGRTTKGKLRTVIFTLRGTKIRPITAFTPTRKVRRLYAKASEQANTEGPKT
ncbi:MAG: BrnT family toxin [Bacteroidia bacterium]|nr:BrnT family toxin [Bacteroidia bacterium]